MFEKWIVDYGNWASGGFRRFRKEKDAIEFIVSMWGYPIIRLRHGNERFQVKTDPMRYKTREKAECDHHWVSGFGEVCCTKCGSKIPLACEHGGSIACNDCTTKFANDLNSSEDHGKASLEKWWKGQGIHCSKCGAELEDGKCPNKYCIDKIKVA